MRSDQTPDFGLVVSIANAQAQVGTAAKEAGKATAETTKQGVENAKVSSPGCSCSCLNASARVTDWWRSCNGPRSVKCDACWKRLKAQQLIRKEIRFR